jgi:hypothetical protein
LTPASGFSAPDHKSLTATRRPSLAGWRFCLCENMPWNFVEAGLWPSPGNASSGHSGSGNPGAWRAAAAARRRAADGDGRSAPAGSARGQVHRSERPQIVAPPAPALPAGNTMSSAARRGADRVLDASLDLVSRRAGRLCHRCGRIAPGTAPNARPGEVIERAVEPVSQEALAATVQDSLSAPFPLRRLASWQNHSVIPGIRLGPEVRRRDQRRSPRRGKAQCIAHLVLIKRVIVEAFGMRDIDRRKVDPAEPFQVRL